MVQLYTKCVSRSSKSTARGLVGAASVLVSLCVFGVYWRAEEPFVGELASEVAAQRIAIARNDPHRPIRIVVLAQDDVSVEPSAELLEALRAMPTFSVNILKCAEVGTSNLQGIDVVLVPGGSGRAWATALGRDGGIRILEFVRRGGGYVGICGGSFLATCGYEWSLGLINARTLTGDVNVGETDVRSMATRGAGMVRMETTDLGAKVFDSVPRLVDVHYSSGPIVSKGHCYHLGGFVSLAQFRSEILAFEVQRGTMVDTPAIVFGECGRGAVILFSPHPELSGGLRQMIPVAIRLVAPAPCAQTQ